MAVIIDGKKTSARIRAEVREKCAAFVAEHNVTPGLAVVIVGQNPASQIYVRNKKRACDETGIYSEIIALAEETTQQRLLSLIDELNGREDIHGILVQLPLPSHIDGEAVLAAVSPDKDVDAFSAVNVGKIMMGSYDLLPCTPAGVMELLREYGADASGRECVVVGRSNIVGKPMAMLLLHANGTVTVAHSRTKNLADITRRADILVAAVGRARMIKADMIKDGAVVIDVGMNRLPDGTLCGDVDFEQCEKKASAITPVPGGVGPMTVTMLMCNTLRAAQLYCGKK